MNKLKIASIVLLAVALGTFVLQNRVTVKTQILFTSFELPLILLLGLTTLTGFVGGLLLATLSLSPRAK